MCPKKRQRELAELNLRISGSSSAWCSAHNVSAAAGRMFEDPEILRFSSARLPWSLEQQSTRQVYAECALGGDFDLVYFA
ncbi:MAG: hypothetical protein IPL83_11285 [Bdellovibrionales bacterium]|nr:hypothetical protein [Bdellovibrionales bacterium]